MTESGVEGTRSSVRGAGGVDIGILTAGSGPSLLLVHGGAGQIERWGPVWPALTERWRVTAMDRRGRGSSGDADTYSIEEEFGDVAAVASFLAGEAGGPIDVFAHSYGATCTLGAAGRALRAFRRTVLYEPPGARTISPEWVDRVSAMVAEGRAGRAMVSFLMEIIGLSSNEVDELRRAPPPYDILAVLSATLPREARALLGVELSALASAVTGPCRLLLGENSPSWAGANTEEVAGAIAGAEIVSLPGVGHEAINDVPELVVSELHRFLGSD